MLSNFFRRVWALLPGRNDPVVWYAAYGSNLDESRFRLYLEGGTPEPGARTHSRCPSGVDIIAIQPYETIHRLYFAGNSHQWHGGGVAFLELEPRAAERTLCRAYQLKLSQFAHVAAEENGGHPVRLDRTVLKSRMATVRDRGWYRVVINLGFLENVSVLTLTGVLAEVGALNSPSAAYLGRIKAGLQQTYPALSAEAIDEYLARAQARER